MDCFVPRNDIYLYNPSMKVLSIFNSEDNLFLRQPSRKISEQDFQDQTVDIIIKKLENTLEYYGNGVGLSAIQIGYPVQIFKINCRPTDAFPTMENFQQIIINPIITHYSTEIFDGREWCMSIADDKCIPQQRYQVRRSTQITFDYTDEHSIKHTNQTLSGVAAVVFQHEYDHLFGKLIDEAWLRNQIITNDEYQQRRKQWEQMVLS